MEPSGSIITRIFFKLFLYTVPVFMVMGSVSCHKAPPPAPAPKARPQQKSIDTKAQQQHYDRGLQLYSKENYKQARAAFQQAVQLGPNTTVGLKSQENLKKIQQILKTLEEIQAK